MMRLCWACGGLSVICICAAAAATSSTAIEGQILLPDGSGAVAGKVLLNGGAFVTLTDTQGSFTFPAVPAGLYHLEVLSTQHYFSQAKINVRPEAAQDKVQVNEYRYPGAAKQRAAYPIRLVAHSEYQYYEARNAFGALRAQLNSPMFYMLLLSVAMAFFFPKMLDGMSEEQKKELQNQNPTSLWSELLGGGGKRNRQASAAAEAAAGARR